MRVAAVGKGAIVGGALSALLGAAPLAAAPLAAAGPSPAPAGSEVVAAPASPAADTLTIARLRYDGGGDWYANPSSLPNLLRTVRDRTGLPVSERPAETAALDPALPDHPYLYMTGHGNVAFSAAERAALREHLLAGGFLHADDNYGLDPSFRREMEAIFPDRPLVRVPPDHPVFHVLYDFPDGLPKIHEHEGKAPEAWGIFDDGRLMVFYSFESDLGDGWEDPDVHDDPAEVRERALRMGVNLFLHVLGQGTG